MRYEAAAALLPPHLRAAVMTIPMAQRQRAEEFRLRTGRVMTVLLPEEEREVGPIVTEEDLERLCDLATDFSRYTATETLCQGYITAKGGIRVGVCGAALRKDGKPGGFQYFSSMSIRIPRERIGIADDLASGLFQNGIFVSTLIVAPPGGGKTTLLRDLVRTLSCGGSRYPPCRVALIDERSEVAMLHRGRPQMDVGPHTDVLDGCPKAAAIPMVLRAMNPQVIAIDELALQEDLEAVMLAAGCGVGLIATMHAASVRQLQEKPLYQALKRDRVFHQALQICMTHGGRSYEMEELP